MFQVRIFFSNVSCGITFWSKPHVRNTHYVIKASSLCGVMLDNSGLLNKFFSYTQFSASAGELLTWRTLLAIRKHDTWRTFTWRTLLDNEKTLKSWVNWPRISDFERKTTGPGELWPGELCWPSQNAWPGAKTTLDLEKHVRQLTRKTV